MALHLGLRVSFFENTSVKSFPGSSPFAETLTGKGGLLNCSADVG